MSAFESKGFSTSRKRKLKMDGKCVSLDQNQPIHAPIPRRPESLLMEDLSRESLLSSFHFLLSGRRKGKRD